MRRLRSAFCVYILVLIPGLAAAGTPQTFLILNSQPGDYIGQGQYQVFTTSDGTFTAQSTYRGGVAVSFQGGNSDWSLYFGPPDADKFVRAEYEGIQRFAFHSPGKPGMDVYGDGRGCNMDTGRFLMTDIAIAQDGTIERLAIDFEQHCEGNTPALYGSIRFNSAVSAVPRFGIGNATALKGSAGTDDGGMIVALSMPAKETVSVQFQTGDGTGIAGTDYVATKGSVEFPAGTTWQPITIPIIGDRLERGNKIFHIELNSPQGAKIGPAENRVKTIDPNVPLTALAMSSQPGDYIGQGQMYLYTPEDTTFTPSRNFDNGVSISLGEMDNWETDFAAPGNATLVPGVYDNAQRFPFQPSNAPGLSVYGEGRGCNTLTGRFVVKDAKYGSNGDVEHFAADLEQHCEGSSPALFGWVRYKSHLQQVSVTDAVIENGRSAAFTVTLNPPSKHPVSVKFATVDGSAIGGVDYVVTSKTIRFAAGETEHTVTVKLLTAGNGQKEFFGQLSSPSRAPVWISQGSATF
jgi:hypothetical protein